ncbi:MAG: acyl-CoA dehydrogenase, partial [Bacteroidetes bacterium QH_2_63_10]
DHVAGRSVVDSRPFQIFEGSNDVLYQQISESVLKSMRTAEETNLHAFLQDHDLTSRAADYFSDTLDFEVDQSLPQRRLVELGRVLGRVVTMDMVIELGDRGFRSDLISNCLQVFQKNVEGLITTYQRSQSTSVIEDYGDGAAWLDYVDA